MKIRDKNIEKLKSDATVWDVVVIGGGSSGLGVALDALSRGLKVALLEKADFAKGTSSRSTKLLHGGVRYLAQGDVGLVFEALRERGKLLRNAPHITSVQPFVIPIYSVFNLLKYTIGLKVYDWMSINFSIGSSEILSAKTVIQKLPNVKQKGLRGGVLYYDGQFDDARLAVNLMQTCHDMGGAIINYTEVKGLLKDKEGKVNGVEAYDRIGKKSFNLKAKMVVNATGVFTDKILRMDQPEAKKMIQPSQGVHLVFDQSFLSNENALMIPKTSDGRVLFAVPWHGKLVVGTTDTLRKKPKLEPEALKSEIEFILKNAGDYLVKAPTKEDVLAIYAGLRPLAAPSDEGEKTKEISRSHKVIISDSKLVTLTGGKWTTFRKMGEDTMDHFQKVSGERINESTSSDIKLHAYKKSDTVTDLSHYGTDAEAIRALQNESEVLAEKLHQDFSYTMAEVHWAVTEEMAVTLEDVLSRRLRILIQDAKVAVEVAPNVANYMAKLLDRNEEWVQKQLEKFNKLAKKYQIKI